MKIKNLLKSQVYQFTREPMAWVVLAVCLTAVTVCRDFENQTIKYDILAGYTSAQAVYGRLLFSMAIGLIALLLYVLLPVVWFSVKNGYGTAVPFSGYALSVVICMLLLVRIWMLFRHEKGAA